MLSTVGRDDAIRVAGDVFVKKDELAWQLDDASRRADAGNPRPPAMENAIRLRLTRLDILDLCVKFRFVGWSFRPRQAARDVLECLMARALLDLRRRRLAVDHSLQSHWRDVDRVSPVS